jgi:hypothetical protein
MRDANPQRERISNVARLLRERGDELIRLKETDIVAALHTAPERDIEIGDLQLMIDEWATCLAVLPAPLDMRNPCRRVQSRAAHHARQARRPLGLNLMSGSNRAAPEADRCTRHEKDVTSDHLCDRPIGRRAQRYAWIAQSGVARSRARSLRRRRSRGIRSWFRLVETEAGVQALRPLRHSCEGYSSDHVSAAHQRNLSNKM